MKKIGIIVGSLRKGSFSKKVADAAASFLSPEYEAHFIDLSQLEMFNQDYDDEGNVPASWTAFREQVKEMDGYLFVTPEYNRSLPPVLKNALDIGSRPYGANVWSGKPGAIFSVSPGGMGGFGANHHLRQVLVFLNIYTMQQPEVYLSNITGSLDEEGNLTSERTLGFLEKAVKAFEDWSSNFNK